MRPRLVAVAHGTRHPDGPRNVELLMSRVRRRLPNVDVSTCYLELVEPSLRSVMAGSAAPVVVVPLLLSTGYHVTHDLPEAARASRNPITLARALGPHPLLAGAMGMHLRAAGSDRSDALVMVAAGSSDPGALVDTHAAGRMLEARWRAPVKVAHLTGAGRRLPDVMDGLRRAGHKRIAMTPYLLAPGHFAAWAQELAEVNGACVTSDVLGDHPMVVELIIRRYVGAVRRWSSATTMARGERPPPLPPMSEGKRDACVTPATPMSEGRRDACVTPGTPMSEGKRGGCGAMGDPLATRPVA